MVVRITIWANTVSSGKIILVLQVVAHQEYQSCFVVDTAFRIWLCILCSFLHSILLGLEKYKETIALTCMAFPCMITLRSKTVAHSFLPSFEKANALLSQARLLWSSKFATMAMWCHTLLALGYMLGYPLSKARWMESHLSVHLQHKALIVIGPSLHRELNTSFTSWTLEHSPSKETL